MLAKKLFEHRKTSKKKDDPFKKIEFRSLEDMAITVVAQHYDKHPELEGITPQLKGKIIEMIKSDYPIHYTCPYISDETYWQRACDE
jgi:hypothetical protein